MVIAVTSLLGADQPVADSRPTAVVDTRERDHVAPQ